LLPFHASILLFPQGLPCSPPTKHACPFENHRFLSGQGILPVPGKNAALVPQGFLKVPQGQALCPTQGQALCPNGSWACPFFNSRFFRLKSRWIPKAKRFFPPPIMPVLSFGNHRFFVGKKVKDRHVIAELIVPVLG